MALRPGLSSAVVCTLGCALLAVTACVPRSSDFHTLSGTVSGLEGTGLVLALNATSDGGSLSSVSVGATGDAGAASFVFSSQLSEGASYTISVATQPSSPAQVCSVSHGSGTVGATNVTDVTISCVVSTFSLGGTFSNLTGVDLSVVLTLTDPTGSTTDTLDVTATASDSTSYDFTSVAADTYTLTPSVTATGYTFTPASATIVLSSGATQDFTIACAAEYTSCSSGCCPKAIAISAGYEHSCALLYGGTIKCWGHNSEGQLGDNSTTDRLTPTSVVGAYPYSAVAAGSQHTCAILADGTDAGTILCWGSNSDGQLGSYIATAVDAGPADAGASSALRVTSDLYLSPTTIADTSTFSSLAAGMNHNCAILADGGALRCWGRNISGQLGDNTMLDENVPVATVDDSTYAAVVGGNSHTCGLLADGGIIKCWGLNRYGQIGDGTDTQQLVPTTVVSAFSYSKLAAGQWHNCAIIAGTGTVQCWGWNNYGQIGNGSTTTAYSTPASIADSSAFAAISAGDYHTCGIIADAGAVKCWGHNAYGQLGNNSTTNALWPVSLSDSSSTYSAIAAGQYHTCGIVADAGTVKCWGDNAYGQLGDGTTTDRALPVDVQF